MIEERTTQKWTLDEYRRLGEQGFFSPDERVERINGEIVEMSPVGKRHKACVSRLNHLMVRLVQDSAVVYVQNPLVVKNEEPVPDLALLKPEPTDYAERGATAADALLVIEVSDTPLTYDQDVKVPMYAAGVPEVWVVDLNANRIWVYPEPKAGSYTQVQGLERSAGLSVQQLPSVSLTVDEVLG